MKKTLPFPERFRDFLTDQSGAAGILAGVAILVLLGSAALAMDIGRIAAVKSELQKAADAAALAGARSLNLPSPVNWVNGVTVATNTAKENQANGSNIIDCQVQAGYWDLNWNAGSAPANLKAQGITPGPTDEVAVKVTITKGSGANGGPLPLFFAPILGKKTAAVTAQATACLLSYQSPVNQIPAGYAFPLATPISWVNKMWKPNQNSDSFRIGSAYHYPDGGQWTSFLLDANNVPTIRNLIDNGNPTPISIGDEIWIEPGTKDTLFAYAEERIGYTVLLPVVKDNFDTHAWTPILGFVPFYIEDAVGGSGKYIQGHFVPKFDKGGIDIDAPNIIPNGTAYGSNAKLVS